MIAPELLVNKSYAIRTASGLVLFLCCACSLTGCGQAPAVSPAPVVILTGRAILPADTFADGPAVGQQLAGEVNGRQLPFATVPVQGFSSLIIQPDHQYLVLQDNGFGTMANSPHFPLRWYRLQMDLDQTSSPVEVLSYVELSDPHGLLPFTITNPDSGRILTGADFDPESFVQAPDGTFWLGEEFGPSLIHVAADGTVLGKPVYVPIPKTLRDFSRGSPFYRTPDHPDLRFLRRDDSREELANLPRSGGIEGLAMNSSGSRVYVALEKALWDDPRRDRRLILEFDPAHHTFTGHSWFYQTSAPDVSVSALETVTPQVFLVLERDPAEGRAAHIKRIYRVDLEQVGADGFLSKTLVCDLLKINDERGLTQREKGAVGLGTNFQFPYVTPECLTIVDPSTIIVANDNNYPMSSGRRPPHTPDPNEFIRLHLPQPLVPIDESD